MKKSILFILIAVFTFTVNSYATDGDEIILKKLTTEEVAQLQADAEEKIQIKSAEIVLIESVKYLRIKSIDGTGQENVQLISGSECGECTKPNGADGVFFPSKSCISCGIEEPGW